MISSAEFAAYNRAVARIGDKAASDVESSVLAWCRANASASVAEKREAAKLIMDGYVQGYDDIAAEFAAEWYDHRAQKSGVALDQAITMTTYKPESVDDVARYQAKKLAKGGDAEFAKACGEFARNDAFRSLNETVVANVGRDRDKGARFARVPTGLETCTFCLMLASRGAVYHTRKSAGEFKHFHRGCDCKVVPSFEKDPMATLVDGHDPKDELRRWTRIENARRQSRELIQYSGDFEKDTTAAVRAWIDHDSVDMYRATIGEYLASLNPTNVIKTEDYVVPMPKEVMEAYWLSQLGMPIEFRCDFKHIKTDGNTSDIKVGGVTCDMKQIKSASVKKMKRRITEKIPRQGPVFMVDISESPMTFDAAEAALSQLLDDPCIERIYLTNGKRIEELKK